MKTIGNTQGTYDMLQGADGPVDMRVFGISAVIAVLVVSVVVAFKMAAPEIKAAVLNQWPLVAHLASQTGQHAVAPTQGSMAVQER